MDKVKIYLAWLVKHHFWVLSGTTVVLGLVGWFLAANALADIYKKRKTAIEGKHSIVKKIKDTPDHPNKSFEEGVNALLDKPKDGLKARVLLAWKDSFDEQKKVLAWAPALGQDTLEAIEAAGDNGEIPVDFRERYFNYVRNEFPELLKIVDAQNYNEMQAERGGMRRDPEDEDPAKKQLEHKVLWRADDQRSLDEALDWPRAPSSKEMRCVQENLWVYQALLKIIAKVNENSSAHYNAKIKEIISLQIARPAAQEFQLGMGAGKLIPPQAIGAPIAGGAGVAPMAGMQPPPAAVGEAAPGVPPPIPGGTTGRRPPRSNRSAGGGGGRQGGGGMGGSSALDSVQDEGRYVDGAGAPLTASAATPPEFKRMPIFLQLYMDQREISRLLVECANSPLPVEVKQLRVNPSSLRRPGRVDVSSIFAEGAKPAGGGGGRAVGLGGGEVAASDRELNPYDMPVEIQGIIYIFNRPNREKLAVAGQAVTAPASDETPDGEGAPAKPADKAPDADAAASEKTPAGETPDAGATRAKADTEETPPERPATTEKLPAPTTDAPVGSTQ